jgi:hypothetical protein
MTALYRIEPLTALKAKKTARGVTLNHTAADARRKTDQIHSSLTKHPPITGLEH